MDSTSIDHQRLGTAIKLIDGWIERNVTLCSYAYEIYSDFYDAKIDNIQIKIYDVLLIFAQNMDYRYLLEAVLPSTHNLCSKAKTGTF